MKKGAVLFLIVAATVLLAKAEDSPPTVEPSPQATGAETNEPALPTPEGSVPVSAPGLLPESSELPEHVPVERPISHKSAASGQKIAAVEDQHFDNIRLQAMKNSRAVYLLKRADHSSKSSSRRSYLRAYYANVAEHMRRLDPALKSSINAYEEAKMQELGGEKTPVHTSQATHHHLTRKSRYVSHHTHPHHHRYWRPVYDEDPYGPDYYGPPVVFYPW